MRLKSVVAWVLLCVACREQNASSRVHVAKFGIFYGGQVQERVALPFDLDRARQVLGIHLELVEPNGRDMIVRWELDMPVASRRQRDNSGSSAASRRVRLGQSTLRAGRAVLDQPLYFEPGDPLGVWNVRVSIDDELVIDRSLLVYDRNNPPPELVTER